MDSILLPKNFDISNVTYGNVKTLESGGKTVPILYNGRPFVYQTPEMIALFGSSSYKADKDKPIDKKTLELSFKGYDSRPNLERHLNNMKAVDDKLLDDAIVKSMEWFKKNHKSREVVAELYTPLVKYAKDKETGDITDKYPPTFRLNIPFRDNLLACDIYNDKKEPLKLTDIDRGSKVTAIIQCTGIWLAAGKFGCSWKVLQLRVVPPEAIKGFAFKDIEDDKVVESDIEEDEEEVAVPNDTAVPTQDDPSAPEDQPQQVVESSDDEEDEIEQPKVVKKVTRKKN